MINKVNFISNVIKYNNKDVKMFTNLKKYKFINMNKLIL